MWVLTPMRDAFHADVQAQEARRASGSITATAQAAEFGVKAIA